MRVPSVQLFRANPFRVASWRRVKTGPGSGPRRGRNGGQSTEPLGLTWGQGHLRSRRPPCLRAQTTHACPRETGAGSQDPNSAGTNGDLESERQATAPYSCPVRLTFGSAAGHQETSRPAGQPLGRHGCRLPLIRAVGAVWGGARLPREWNARA